MSLKSVGFCYLNTCSLSTNCCMCCGLHCIGRNHFLHIQNFVIYTRLVLLCGIFNYTPSLWTCRTYRLLNLLIAESCLRLLSTRKNVHIDWWIKPGDAMRPGPWFNIKMTSYQYRKSHCGDKTILRPSYLHNGISYTGKMPSLYWIRALTLN